MSGFSVPEFAHTLWALTPRSVETSDTTNSDPAENEPDAAFAASGERAIVVVIAAVGCSAIAPLQMRLTPPFAPPDGFHDAIRFVNADDATHSDIGGESVCPDAVLTRIAQHEPAALAGIESLRTTWHVPVAAMIAPSIAIADMARLAGVLDDYIVEPARTDEMLIRLRCLVARQRNGGGHYGERHGDRFSGTADPASLVIDEGAKSVRLQGRTLHLTPKEFDLLRLLASQSGRVFSDAEIIARLWPNSAQATPVDVAQYIHRLRKKLNDNPCAPQWIFNIKRFGYMLRRSTPHPLPSAASVNALPPRHARASGRFDSP